MKQPIKKNKKNDNKVKTVKKVKVVKKQHPKYGTSKLEDDFAKEFLDK